MYKAPSACGSGLTGLSRSRDRRHGLILDDCSCSFQVRFAALITVLALAEKLRENYIVLLPESIPFLAELMEGKSAANTDKILWPQAV